MSALTHPLISPLTFAATLLGVARRDLRMAGGNGDFNAENAGERRRWRLALATPPVDEFLYGGYRSGKSSKMTSPDPS